MIFFFSRLALCVHSESNSFRAVERLTRSNSPLTMRTKFCLYSIMTISKCVVYVVPHLLAFFCFVCFRVSAWHAPGVSASKAPVRFLMALHTTIAMLFSFCFCFLMFAPGWHAQVCLLRGDTLQETKETLDERYTGVITTGWRFWPFVHIFTYFLIPPRHRVLWVRKTKSDAAWWCRTFVYRNIIFGVGDDFFSFVGHLLVLWGRGRFFFIRVVLLWRFSFFFPPIVEDTSRPE